MTKAELEKDRNKWKSKAESLQDEIDLLNEYVGELENINYDLCISNNDGIYNLDNFIFRAKIDNMWTEELQHFIDDYMRFHNESR